MKGLLALIVAVLLATAASADPLNCDLAGYTAQDGLTASVEADVLILGWTGDAGADLRMRLVIQNAQPMVRELAIRRRGGAWAVLGQDLSPEYHVTSGIRRLSYQQSQPLEATGVEITQEVIDREKWYVFWDAPLVIPGVTEGRNPRNWGVPRSPDEIRRMDAAFNTSSCGVKTDGARLEVTFPGLEIGIFAGDLRFTVYRDTNLIRMEAIAKTEEDCVGGPRRSTGAASENGVLGPAGDTTRCNVANASYRLIGDGLRARTPGGRTVEALVHQRPARTDVCPHPDRILGHYARPQPDNAPPVLFGLPRPASQPAIHLRRACLAPAPTGAKQGPHANDMHLRPPTVGDAGDPDVARRHAVRMRLEIRGQGLTNRLLDLRPRVCRREHRQPGNVGAHRATRFGFNHNRVVARH